MPRERLLTDEQKRTIFEKWIGGQSQDSLAVDYGVSQSTIFRAIKEMREKLEDA